MTTTEIPSDPIDMAAAAWDARLRSPDCTEADREAFVRWEAADPRHAAAFENLQIILEVMRGLAERPQLRALREEANAGWRQGRWQRWAIGLTAAAASVALLAVGGRDIVRRLDDPPAAATLASASAGKPDNVYRTALDERTVVTLEDGSTVSLNANSMLEAAFKPWQRDVRLVRGQALFRVSKDPDRPFVVQAGDRQIVAVGTEFDVRLDRRSVRVTLIEGKVRVRRMTPSADIAASAAEERQLLPNQMLIARTDATPQLVTAVDTAKLTSWTVGRIFFEDTPLDEAVAEMNRYSRIQIAVADPTLSRYRVNGMFRTGSQTSFVGALEAYFPIAAQADERQRILLSRREP